MQLQGILNTRLEVLPGQSLIINTDCLVEYEIEARDSAAEFIIRVQSGRRRQKLHIIGNQPRHGQTLSLQVLAVQHVVLPVVEVACERSVNITPPNLAKRLCANVWLRAFFCQGTRSQTTQARLKLTTLAC